MKTFTKATISSLIGNAIEWYEYMLYAHFATVISQLFFPSHDGNIAIMLTFATFFIGFAARPIGGIIFGHIGDKFSRKKMLTITMLLMSIPTFILGALPTYASVGRIATIALVIIRILQGLALGGEHGASCVYLYESATKNKRGFFGALSFTGVGLGLMLSSCTIFAIEYLFTKEEIYAYAWRIPFFVSVIGAIIGLYMRQSLGETEDFLAASQNNKLVKAPFIDVIKTHKKSLLKLFMMGITASTSFFIVFVFCKSLMVAFLHYSPARAGKFNLFMVTIYTLSTLLFWMIPDRINRHHIVRLSTAGIFLIVYPFMLSMQSGNAVFILFTSLLLSAFIGLLSGSLNTIVAESFAPQIRATGVAFFWNISSVVFGASSPMISMQLLKNNAGVSSLAYYLMAVCIITILGGAYESFKRKWNKQ